MKVLAMADEPICVFCRTLALKNRAIIVKKQMKG